MTHTDMAHEDSEDRFYAQFDSREVELMTLDELAVAFEEGRIHGNTFVCREGESEWATLTEVAGLGEEEEAAPPPVVVSERRPAMPQRQAEMAVESRPPMPQRTVVIAGSASPALSSQSRPPMPERRPEMNTVPAARFAAVAAPLSYAPVTSNVNFPSVDLDDEMALRPKRRWGRVLLAAAALTVVGGGAAFALGGGSIGAVASAVHMPAAQAASNIETKPAEPVAAAPVAPVAPVADPTPAAAPVVPSAAAPSTAPGLSDDMKAALLAQDKVKSSKHAAKASKVAKGGGGGAVSHGKAAHSAAGIKSGGSAYDPLNGNL